MSDQLVTQVAAYATHNRLTSKSLAGLEPTIAAINRFQTCALDRVCCYFNCPNDVYGGAKIMELPIMQCVLVSD